MSMHTCLSGNSLSEINFQKLSACGSIYHFKLYTCVLALTCQAEPSRPATLKQPGFGLHHILHRYSLHA